MDSHTVVTRDRSDEDQRHYTINQSMDSCLKNEDRALTDQG